MGTVTRSGLARGYFHAQETDVWFMPFHPRIRVREEPFRGRRNERSADGTVFVDFDHLNGGGGDRRRWKGTLRG